MPKTKDKFKTIVDGSYGAKSATVIRKGSDASKIFGSMKAKIMNNYIADDPGILSKSYPATENRINKKASDQLAADRAVGFIKMKPTKKEKISFFKHTIKGR